jgi:2OG-Fe(II) oxygenase superfamily
LIQLNLTTACDTIVADSFEVDRGLYILLLTTAMSQSQDVPEHEIQTYLRVSEALSYLECGIPIEINTALTKALDAMSCMPVVQFPAEIAQCALFIEGTPAGTLDKPEVELLLQKSTLSSFGRGDKTVTDPAYRSGREIPATNIGFEDGGSQYSRKLDSCGRSVVKTMFPGRQVTLKLYKLAIYETNGHFDWHMDSTHSDSHLATLLVGLNTSWKGGDLILRRNGVETRADLQPQSTGSYLAPDLQAIAFYTDMEHRVEPITEGVRIVLQYDIEVVTDTEKKMAEEDFGDYDWPLDVVSTTYSDRTKYLGVVQATADKTAVEEVIDTIKRLHTSGVGEVGFALQHLYRKASIRAEFLKGSDAYLYDRLVRCGAFNVTLCPVVLVESGDDDETSKRFAYLFGDYNYDDDDQDTNELGNYEKPSRFHIPKLSAIEKISSQDYIEHTGNESMLAEYRYFSGGMFVRPRLSS